MASLKFEVNQWLQDAVEYAVGEYVRNHQAVSHSLDQNDSSQHISLEFTGDKYGVSVKWQAGSVYRGDGKVGTEYFTPQEAFKIFMEHKEESYE